MAGRHRLIIGDITQSKVRGPALIKAIGQMNKSGTTPYYVLASTEKKSKKSKKK